MATKQQAVERLRKHEPCALLIDESYREGFQVQLEAPRGCHWEGSVHCHATPFWFKGDYPKAEYWDFVIEEIDSLPPAVPCEDEDCEGIRDFGECEYWSGEMGV